MDTNGHELTQPLKNTFQQEQTEITELGKKTSVDSVTSCEIIFQFGPLIREIGEIRG